MKKTMETTVKGLQKDLKRTNSLIASYCAERDTLEKQLYNLSEKPKMEEMIGKTLKYPNNSYSCPEKQSDYWDIYCKITEIDDGNYRAIKFETDSRGQISFEPSAIIFGNSLSYYFPCSEKEFDDELRKVVATLSKSL